MSDQQHEQGDGLSADALEVLGHEEIARGHARLAQAKRIRADESAGVNDTLIDKDNCKALRLTPRSFEDNAHRGAFPAFKSGGRLVAYRADVDRWIRSRKVTVRSALPLEDDVGEAYESTIDRMRGGAR
ncbi:helix-turn-helix domain-containing protein [Pendulispora rubella]|uniref:Helix-turn-helix domain-containing protein n=1 Tax=Pendulispora rubella TaxID=2741070 RepID=A0ABZ2LDT7_9BACT